MAKVTTNARSVVHTVAPRNARRFGRLAAHLSAREVARSSPPALQFLLMALVSTVLVGCGNKGDLYLDSTRAAAINQVEVIDETIDEIEVTVETEGSDQEDQDAEEDEEDE